MPRFALSLSLGLAIVAGMVTAAAAGGRRSGNVSTPYGTFSAQEMQMGGGNPEMAMQLRQQKQAMLYQQQELKQQQAYQQQQAKQAEFLKKHPEAAKALNPTQTTTAAPTAGSKAGKKADKGKAAGTKKAKKAD